MSSEIFQLLLPAAILVLLVLAPRRGGRGGGSPAVAKVIAIWAVVAVCVGVFWNRYGLALLWKMTADK